MKHLLPRIFISVFIFLMALCVPSAAQVSISGIILDEKNIPLESADIRIAGTTLGAVTNEEGFFLIETRIADSLLLIVSSLGHFPDSLKIFPGRNTAALSFTLKRNSLELKDVTISAGVFSIGDKKNSLGLKAREILTTPGSGGDLFASISLLPGSMNIGEQEGLFVRGGSNLETKTYIDGLLAPNPFFSGLPEVKQRSRFPALLFNGIYFSTGGFSSQYGNALSSALLLKSRDMPDSTISRMDANFTGISIMHDHRWENTSFGIIAEYYNQSFTNSLTQQSKSWKIDPRHGGGNIFFRHRTESDGLWKFFGYYEQYHGSLNYPNLNDTALKPSTYLYDLKNYNGYSIATLEQPLGSRWNLSAGTSFSYNRDLLNSDSSLLNGTTQLVQGRIQLTRNMKGKNILRFGTESNLLDIVSDNDITAGERKGIYSAPYLETDIHLGGSGMMRAGLRGEYSSLLKDFQLSPRISVGYAAGNYSQFSFAFGKYFEIPEEDYILNFTDVNMSPLGFESSTHYILNYTLAVKKQMLRIEAYYKDYDNLLSYVGSDTSNQGYGFARGVDLFWRDRKTFNRLDYWISYTLLDTRRKFLDYPISAEPSFTTPHTVNVMARYLIPTDDLMLGVLLEFATGRTYFNPESTVYLSDKTPNYKNFSVSGNYRFPVVGYLAQIGGSIGNVFGIDNIFTFKYSDDSSRIEAVRASSRRNIFFHFILYLGRKYEPRG